MRKLLVINLAVLAGLVAAAELAAGLIAQQRGEPLALIRLARTLKSKRTNPARPTDSACARQTRWTPVSPYVPEPTLGYWYRRNSRHTATIQLPAPVERMGIVGAVDQYQWTLTTGPQGERLSRPADQPRPAGPAVLLLGDSFLFGAGLSDNASLAWQLQSLLPGRAVANYAGGGFGTVHQWLMLRDASSRGRLIPGSLQRQLRGGQVLLGHADYYLKRNVAAPSRLATFNPRCGTFQQQLERQPDLTRAYTHPQASLIDGAVVISQIPLFQEHRGPDPDPSTQLRVTQALVDDLIAMVRDLNATPTVLWVRGADDDPVIAQYRQQGVAVLDLRGGDARWTRDTLEPFDNHPGPLSTSQWAARIASHLAAL